jgi:hypothetical protein
MPHGVIHVELSKSGKYLKNGGFYMDTNQAEPCIFCGTNAEEQHASSIGVVFVHSECLVDLEEILSLPEEEMEEIKG